MAHASTSSIPIRPPIPPATKVGLVFDNETVTLCFFLSLFSLNIGALSEKTMKIENDGGP